MVVALLVSSISATFGAMFLVAGFRKLASTADHARAVSAGGILSRRAAGAVTRTLTVLEPALGLWLCSFYAGTAAFGALLAVLLVFFAYRLAVVHADTGHGCGCFAPADRRLGATGQAGAGAIYLTIAGAGLAAARLEPRLPLELHLAGASAGAALALLLLRGALRLRRRDAAQ